MEIKLILKTFLLPSLLIFGSFSNTAVAQTYHDGYIESGQHCYEAGLISTALGYFKSALHCPECDKAGAFKHLESLGWIYLENQEFGRPDGFILQKMKAQLEERYVEFTPFDETTGYMAAIKSDRQVYLVDASGQEYRLANRLEALTSDVEALDLRSALLDSLPADIFKHTQLKILWVSGVQKAPEQLGDLKNLVDLQISGNFERLPASIGQLKKLKKLDLASYQFKTLPPELGELGALQQLSIGFHELELPASIGRLGALRYLSIGDFGAKILPAELSGLKQLIYLSVSGYRINQLPSQLGQLSQLEFLNLKGDFESLPPEIGQLNALKNLSLFGAQLVALPEQIGQLAKLEYLRVVGTRLTNFPESIGNLSQLRYLEAHHNQLPRLPESFGQLTELTFLDLRDNQLTQLPENLGKLRKLYSLYLYNNQLEGLPESIAGLKQLAYLSISFNRLKSLPSKLGQLTELKDLVFNNNQIRQLPADLKGWSKLTRLSGEHNLIESLPDGLKYCKSIKFIDFSHNQLTSLPSEVGQLSNLEFLRLTNNQLTAIPESLGRLGKLEYLLLDDNQLKSLPQSLCDSFAYRQNVSFQNNPDIADLPECMSPQPWQENPQTDWNSLLQDRIQQCADLEELGLLRDSLHAVLQDFEKKYKAGEAIPLPSGQQWDSEKDLIEALYESLFVCDMTQVDRYLKSNITAERVAWFDDLLRKNDPRELLTIAGRLYEMVRFTTPAYGNKDKIYYLQKAALLYEKSMSLDSTITEYPIIGQLYNSIGFYQLFLPDGTGAEASIRRGLTFDPDNHYLISNLPPALLLQGKLEAAEAQYRQWKGQRFGIYPNNNQDFRKVFLEDLKDLEAAGIVFPNVDYRTVRGWLE